MASPPDTFTPSPSPAQKVAALRDSLIDLLGGNLDGDGPMTHAVVEALIHSRARVAWLIQKAA